MSNNSLDSIKQQLSHPYMRERREAINRLAEKLHDEKCRNEALQLLKQIAKNYSEATILRDLAQHHLDEDARDHPGWHLAESDGDMVTVNCYNCRRINYFDRRKICGEKTTFYREAILEGEGKLDELRLKCQFCGEDMIVKVDCEGCR